MNIKRNILRRPIALVSALALVLGSITPVLLSSAASAGQVTSRTIQLSDSTPNATSVTYNVSFKPASASAIGAIVVDFCSDSPIIGSTTCAYPAAFTMGATPTVSGLSGIPTSGWVTTSSAQGGAASGQTQVLFYTNPTAQTPTGGATPINFQITGVHNPSTTGSFYARILTFDTAAHATAQYTTSGTTRAASSAFTNMIDYGGAALSTATNIAITATVMETLTFCTSGLVGGVAPTTCAGATTPSVTIGTGTPPTIDASAVYDNSTGTYQSFMVLSTNALSGAVVNMKSNWSCNGLSRNTGSTCDIPGSSANLTAGTAGFGLKVGNGTGGTGAITPASGYSASSFHIGAGVTGLYGDPIAQTGASPAPCSNVVSQLTFGATAGLTTPAGIYTTNEALIATGTF